MIFIYAGDDRQAYACAQWLELDPKHCRTLHSPYDLDGTDGAKVLLFGTYYQRADWPQMRDTLPIVRAFTSALEDKREYRGRY